MLTVSAAGAVMAASASRAASFGNPDQPPQGAIRRVDVIIRVGPKG